MKRNELTTQAERDHHFILHLARKAIRAGDLSKAERWLRVAERNHRARSRAYDEHDRRVAQRIAMVRVATERERCRDPQA